MWRTRDARCLRFQTRFRLNRLSGSPKILGSVNPLPSDPWPHHAEMRSRMPTLSFCVPADLLSGDAVAHLHGEDFIQTFGAEIFRRLPLAQQAAVSRAWANACCVRNGERSKAFEPLLGPIFSVMRSPSGLSSQPHTGCDVRRRPLQ